MRHEYCMMQEENNQKWNSIYMKRRRKKRSREQTFNILCRLRVSASTARLQKQEAQANDGRGGILRMQKTTLIEY